MKRRASGAVARPVPRISRRLSRGPSSSGGDDVLAFPSSRRRSPGRDGLGTALVTKGKRWSRVSVAIFEARRRGEANVEDRLMAAQESSCWGGCGCICRLIGELLVRNPGIGEGPRPTPTWTRGRGRGEDGVATGATTRHQMSAARLSGPPREECIFCRSRQEIMEEHIIPRWVRLEAGRSWAANWNRARQAGSGAPSLALSA